MATDATLEELAGIPLFDGLGREDLARLDELLHDRTFPAGGEIIIEEQPGDVAYIIVSGAVKIHLEQADGTEVILAVLAEGEIVGEMSLVDSLGRSATVSTITESRVMWMGRDAFWDCLRTMPRLTYNLVGLLSRRLRLANTHIETLAALDVQGRIARVLLALGAEYGDRSREGQVTIPIPLTQVDLAALVGASRVRVNQVLGPFRRRGLIAVDREHRVTILDERALEKRAQ